MTKLEELSECDLCGKRGEDLNRFSVKHKELGLIKVCQECLVRLRDDNHMVNSSTRDLNKSPCATCKSSCVLTLW